MFWFQQIKPQTMLLLFDNRIMLALYLKRELVCTNAYKLQASLSERLLSMGMVVIQPYILVSMYLFLGKPRQGLYVILVT